MKVLNSLLKIPVTLWNKLHLQRLKTSFVEFPTIRGRLFVGGRGTLVVGRNVVINSSHRSNPVGGKDRTSILVAPMARIVIGDNVGISNSLIYAWKSIIIEKDVLIGGGCQIFDTDFHSISYEARVHQGDKEAKIAEVIIREGSFIGASSIVLKGVEIGPRSIVAAGSVVSRSIPADEVWGGNPARFIQRIDRQWSVEVSRPFCSPEAEINDFGPDPLD